MLKEINFKDEDIRYDIHGKRLLEALLFASTSKDRFKFPTEKRFILSEVINGTLDYVCGSASAGEVTYLNIKYRLRSRQFESEIFTYLKDKIRSPKKRLDSKIKDIIMKMVYPHSPGDIYLYIYFNDFGINNPICKVSTISTFSLDQETITRVEKEILPYLSKSERKDINGIGKSMREYIEKDLEFIKITDW